MPLIFRNSYLFVFLIVIGILLNVIYLYSGHNLDLLYTKFQESDANDLNFMLYKSIEGVKWNNYNLQVTWGSSGVMILLYPFSLLFNSHLLLFLLIPFIIALTIIDMYTLSGVHVNERQIILKSILLIGSLTYIGIPGKGFLTYISFYFFFKGFSSKKPMWGLLSICISYFNRPWEILIYVLSIMCIWLFSLKNRKTILVVLGSIFLFGAEFALKLISNILKLDLITLELWKVNFDQYSFLASENIILHLILSPLRIIAVIFSLASSAFGSLVEISNFLTDPVYFLWRNLPLLLRFFSFQFFLILIIKIIRKNSWRNTHILFLSYFIIYSSLITLNGVQEKSRYFLIFPIILFPLICTKRSMKY